MGQDLSSTFPVTEQPPVVPEQWRKKKEAAEGQDEKPNPRKNFEENMLRQVKPQLPAFVLMCSNPVHIGQLFSSAWESHSISASLLISCPQLLTVTSKQAGALQAGV